MKKVLLSAVLLSVINMTAPAQLRTPSPSPTQTIRQDFGLSRIELSYSRPGAKNRKVMGDLVPYGKVWRTGANGATLLQFGDDVIIGGTTVPAGKYGLVSIPDKTSWTLILTRLLNVTQPAAYNKDSDVVRVNVRSLLVKDRAETFTMQFVNIGPSSCELQLMWENTVVSLPIKTDIDSKVMSQIAEAMSKDNPPYFAAASYYFDNGKDLAKAKQWAQKAVEATPDAFYIVHLLAKIQAKTGDKKGAIATAQKSIQLSKEAKNDDYVRLNEKLIASLK
ncbi:MAG: DUF2911 domain-containing protein [Williamsia sp.]|nr:DUF2911 domain-containing protein [Williamsia sp.]